MGKYRVLLLISTAMVFVIGLVMIFNTTSAEVLDMALNRSTHQALIKQILYAFLGGICALGLWYLGYDSLLRLSFPLLCLFSFFLLLAFVPGIGKSVNGSRRWIGFATYTFQPSEFVKYLIPLYYIHQYLNREGKEFTFRDFMDVLKVVAVPMVLILLEPNNGTVGVISVTLIVLFTLTGVRFKYWGLPMLILIALASITAYNMDYVSARLRVYLHPELDLKGKGHQPHQAKIAAGSGKIFGKGPGKSLQKLSYLPEAQNDYIAAIFAEEFGFIGLLFLIILYMIIASIGFHIAYYARDKGAFYLASVITFLISFQAFLNLGVVSGLLPSTGLNLPFFSQGGTSLMAHIMGIGVLLNISSVSESNKRKASPWSC